MESCEKDLLKHIDETSMPMWIIDKLKPLGVNGFQIKGYGSPGYTSTESGAIYFEMAKIDASITTFLMVHNAIGMQVIDLLGDEE